MNSLLKETEKKLELTTKNDGIKRQCMAHARDIPIANLSVASWVLIISLFGFDGCSEILLTHDDTMSEEKFNQERP